MHELFPSTPLFLTFLAAALVLAITPGPGVVYIVTRTLAEGRTCGFASLAGVAVGNLGNAVAASIGLAAVFAASAAAFELVRYAGAAYLCYLGIRALMSRPSGTRFEAAPSGNWRVLRQGFLVAALNPKTTLFFAAFLPQFMQPTAAPVSQALLLSAVFVVVAAASDSAYVLLASAVSPVLRASPGAAGLGRYATATVYFTLGLYAVLSGSRPGKV